MLEEQLSNSQKRVETVVVYNDLGDNTFVIE